MPEPIELRPGDIIRRPDTLIPGAAPQESGFSVKAIKGYINQIKEMKAALESIGIDFNGLLNMNIPGMKAGGAGIVEGRLPAPTGGQQLRNFLKLLEARYGDITLDELIGKLKTDFGDWKISSLTKGGMF